MAHHILPLIPQHTVYVEPFCGGATILFAKPWPSVTNSHYYREAINDQDSRLINFYKQLRENGEELVRRIQLTPFSEQEHQESLRETLMCEDKLEAARRYYVNVQQSFSNILNGGWARSVYGTNHAATWINKLSSLHEYIARMQSVHICCADALEVIKKFDSPQTFFYCDPPYPGTDQGHYGGYSVQDFEKLVALLDSCQASFILSNYDQKGIPSNWERFEFSAHCTTRNRSGYDRSQACDESE